MGLFLSVSFSFLDLGKCPFATVVRCKAASSVLTAIIQRIFKKDNGTVAKNIIFYVPLSLTRQMSQCKIVRRKTNISSQKREKRG